MKEVGRGRVMLAMRRAGKRWVWYRVKKKLQHEEYIFFIMGGGGAWHRMKKQNDAFHVWR